MGFGKPLYCVFSLLLISTLSFILHINLFFYLLESKCLFLMHSSFLVNFWLFSNMFIESFYVVFSFFPCPIDQCCVFLNCIVATVITFNDFTIFRHSELLSNIFILTNVWLKDMCSAVAVWDGEQSGQAVESSLWLCLAAC